MAKSVSAKMGIKEDIRAIFIGAPADAIKSISPPNLDVATRLQGSFDYIHFFAEKQMVLQKKFPKLKAHLKEDGMLWVSWPKAKQKETDLTLPVVIKVGYGNGLVESKTLSVNDTWVGLEIYVSEERKGL